MYSSKKKKSVFLGTTGYSLVFFLNKKTNKQTKQATVSSDTTFQFMLTITQK